MPLTEATDALGAQFWVDLGTVEVPVDQIVGTASRPEDFDRYMRPLNRHLRSRWERIAGAVATGAIMPPVRLVQMGELYFVADGHHRVSVARANDSIVIDAQVRRVCTVAYACHCITVLDLPIKLAERQFLERYPLPDEVRPWLWLDDPSDWTLVESSARSWVQARAAGTDEDLAAAWWNEEVVPNAHRCGGSDRPDLQHYLCSLRLRDADGCCVT